MKKAFLILVLLISCLSVFAKPEIYRAEARLSQEHSYRATMKLFAKTKLSENFEINTPILQYNDGDSLEGILKTIGKGAVLSMGIYGSFTYAMFGYSNLDFGKIPKTSPSLNYFYSRPDLQYVFELEIMESHNFLNPYNQQILKGMIKLAQNNRFKVDFLSHSQKMTNYLLNHGVSPTKVHHLPHPFLEQIYSGHDLNLQAQKDLATLLTLAAKDSYRILFLGNHSTKSFKRFFKHFESRWLKEKNPRSVTFFYAPHPNFHNYELKDFAQNLKTEHANSSSLKVVVNHFNRNLSSAQLLPEVDLVLGEYSTLGYLAKEQGFNVILNNNKNRDAYFRESFSSYQTALSSRNYQIPLWKQIANIKPWLLFMKTLSDTHCRNSGI